MKIRTRFYWKHLTNDGLLQPVRRDQQYEWSDTLGRYGYSSRDSAYKDRIQWGDKWEELVLIEVCDLVEDEDETE